MPYFKTADNQELYYNDQGKGEAVILIHGWPVSSAMWEYQATDLIERGYRVISYDRRGFGKSAQPATGYDYDTLAGDLHALIEKLEVSNVSLVGFSMGGGEVARYLGKYGSKKVAKAVLISAVTPFLLKTNDNPDGVDGKVFDDMIAGLRDERPKFLGSFSKDFYGVGVLSKPVSQETLDWHASLAHQASPKATIDCVNAFGKTDFRFDMKAFTMPTLIIHGTADKTVPIASSGDKAAKLISRAIYKKYDGAPHGLFITHKEQLNKDLGSFLGAEELVRDKN